jgi:large repetitive protein
MSAWAVPGYTEELELGRGASGRVVAATSQASGQRVAIKYLSASMVDDPEYMARFRQEARLLTELDVPQVVAVIVVTSPAAWVSNTATFTLSCKPGGGGAGGGGGTHLTLSASAHVSPASSTVGCAFGPSTFTFTGTITASQATTVTYYWALSSGDGPSQTLTFAGPGTQEAAPDTFTPSSDSYTGAGEIVIASPTTRPAAAASNKVTFSQSCTLASLHITTTALPPATQNAAYTATVSAAGGKAPYTRQASGLPAGLKMSTSGAISGSTSASPGSYTVNVTVADSETAAVRAASASTPAPAAESASASLRLTVQPPSYAKLQISTASLPAGTVGAAYGPFQVVAAGGDGGGYTWTASGLPAKLVISPAGVISGTPGQAGSYSVTVTVSDGVDPPVTSPEMTLTVGYPPLTITTASPLPDATQGADYSVGITASGGDGDYFWAETGLPAGFTLDSSGFIGGTTQETGSFTVTVTVNDGETPAMTFTATFTLDVIPEDDIEGDAPQLPERTGRLNELADRLTGATVRSGARI